LMDSFIIPLRITRGKSMKKLLELFG